MKLALGFLLAVLASLATTAWVLMVAAGVVHADWAPAVPSVGYRTAFVLACLLHLGAGVRALITAFFKDLVEEKKQ